MKLTYEPIEEGLNAPATRAELYRVYENLKSLIEEREKPPETIRLES